MPDPGFTLRQLEYFSAVAGEGSLSAAAERCHVSASALTLAVDELERHLGVQLFVRRKGRGVTLTPTGSRMLAQARTVLSQAETLTAQAWQASSSLTGPLSIGCFSTLVPFLLPGIVEDFARAHPGLSIDVLEASTPELHDLLLRGRADMALLYRVDVSPQLGFDPVHEYPAHVIVPASHPLAGDGAVRLSQLADEPLVVLDVHPTRQNTEQIFSSLGIAPRIGHVTGSYELARCLVGRGLGYSVMYQRPATAQTYDGHTLCRLEILDPVPSTTVGLARTAGAPPSARHTALLEHLRAETAGQGVEG